MWVMISASFFAFMPALRAFLLTYMVGLLVLPVGWMDEGIIVFTNSVQIDRITACHLGALIGTLLFAADKFRHYRFDKFDLIYCISTVSIFTTSCLTGTGPYDGLSNAVNHLRLFAPTIILAKCYITTTSDLNAALRAMIGGAVVYSLVAVIEFRLSPQLHRLLYGYFQHTFVQAMRFDSFRPYGALRHAIEFSFFMATSLLAASWLTYKKMMKPLWGWLPAWAVICCLSVGLLCTLTFAGYAIFVAGVMILGMVVVTRSRWVLWILPVIVALWVCGRWTQTIDASSLLNLTKQISNQRSESLDYRIQAENSVLDEARNHAWFGAGPAYALVNSDHGDFVRAVDANWIIRALYYGLIGLVTWDLLWAAAIYTAWRYYRKMPEETRTLATVIAVMLGLHLVDFLFNDFASTFLLILDMGVLSVASHATRARAPVRFMAAPAGARAFASGQEAAPAGYMP